ncbi:hypothetical protein [Streptomyces sp. PT12]|uniref:hypothetical protein n=1 Tax=Streptomyces sp. PT12 TaxID=1510197 RepID=UPI000DE34E1E|nr:hypothetical protein [Streptomyces sp. PT12]RBM18571.1 hypothetical protein DEH69_12885 [Streptomyces sp. PT12]
MLAALRSGLTGCHALNVAAPDSASDVPTAEPFARYHPTTELGAGLGTFGSAVDSSTARELIGFTAEQGWRAAST